MSYIASVCKIKTECNKMSDLCEELREKKYLLILDGCDKFLFKTRGSPRCIREFIGDLLHQCEKIKVLATCRERLGGVLSVGDIAETYCNLSVLSPIDSAQLFWELAPRCVALPEFSCTDPRKAGQCLSQHPVLQWLGGHPGKIFDATQLLSNDIKLNDLPAKMEELQKKLEEEEEKRKKVEEKLTIDTTLTPGYCDNGLLPIVSSRRISMEREHYPIDPPHALRSWSASRMASPPIQLDETTLIWKQYFGDRGVVLWPEFSRFICDHFAQTTKIAYRPLCAGDLQVIQEKLEPQSSKGKVTLQAFASFWQWFRSLEDAILQIKGYWCKDDPKVIYGILSRAQTEALLRTAPVGTFLFRFSDNQLGCLTVAYVEENKSITHSIVNIKGRKVEMQKTSGDIERFNSLSDLVLRWTLLRILYPKHDKVHAFPEDDDDGPH